MAVLQDPTDASFALWQANKQRGTGITAFHGTLCWADRTTSDQARAGQFYSDLFGWQMLKEDEDPDSQSLAHHKRRGVPWRPSPGFAPDRVLAMSHLQII